jgi:hypothetical protein
MTAVVFVSAGAASAESQGGSSDAARSRPRSGFQTVSKAEAWATTCKTRPYEKTRRFQRVSQMELGGFEPPTSWVRCGATSWWSRIASPHG